MQITVAFSDAPTRKEDLIVKGEISKGDCTVYKVYSSIQKNYFALKVFPKTEQGKDQYQKEKLVHHLDHLNVIRCVPIVRDDNYKILTQYARHGTFAEVLEGGPLKTEKIVRTYFRQLIEGLEYIHSQGFAHLDIKLENLVVGSDYSLKIINFEKSQLISPATMTSMDNSHHLHTEGLFETQNKLTAEDIFAAGQVLFAFRTAKLPFKLIDGNPKNHKSYSYFLFKNKELWKKNAKIFLDPILFSEVFIQLVNGMLDPNPSERPTIQDIKKSEWYKGPILDMKELKSMMGPRCKTIDPSHSREKLFHVFLLSLSQYCN